MNKIKRTISYFKKYGAKKTIMKIYKKIINKLLCFNQLYVNKLYGNKSSQIIEYNHKKKHYNIVCKNLKKKIKAKEKITVAFFIIYDSVFPSKPLFERMLDDNSFDPVIIIIPDALRGEENMGCQFDKCYQRYNALYGEKRVLHGYIKGTSNYIDYSEQFDVFCFTNPYDFMTHTFFQMEYLKKKKVLTFFISYGHSGVVQYTSQYVINTLIMNIFWKIFVEYKGELNEYRQWQGIKGKNVIISGFFRSDEYLNAKKIPRQRKRVILAPHHTIESECKNVLELSNFLEYADFFLELPKLYPDIDFIFRPHPLLIPKLKKDDIWGDEKTNAWVTKLLENKNLTYSEGGDFIELFVNSDALIHDCGSFIIDYFFTGNPCCFMHKREANVETTFTNFGIECLKQYYKAYTSTDIINFIDNIVIKNIDPLKRQRIKFVKRHLPLSQNVSEKIIKEIKKAIVYS